jgi:predicted Zn-ribbon and HTH transcriptional regulator
MIELSTDTACLLYLGLAVVTVFTIWLRAHLASRKKKIVEFAFKHHTCEFCHFTYLENPTTELSRCPQCQLINRPRDFEK